MSATQLTILAAIVSYFVAMIIIGIMASRHQSHSGFVIGSRDVGYIPTIGSLSSSFRDGMGVIFWVGFGASVGYGGIWVFIGVVAALLVYAFIGPRARQLAAQQDYITIGEMIRARSGSLTERFSAAIIVCFALMVIAIQLHVAGNLFSMVLGIAPWIGVFSVAIVVGFYLFWGGYSTVVKTDAVQFFIILSLLFMPLFLEPTEAMFHFDTIWALETETIIAFNLIGFFYVLSSADTWQRIFSARNTRVIYFSFPLSGVALLIITLGLIFLGMLARPHLGEVIDTNTVFYEIFKGDYLSPLLQAYIAVVVMAICMSTLDTMCYLTAATIAKNHTPAHLTATRDSYVNFSQKVMLLTLVAMSLVTLTISDLLLFAFSAASLLFILSPLYLFTVFNLPKVRNDKTDRLMTLAIAMSAIIYLYMFSAGHFERAILTLVPVAISTVLTSVAIYFGNINNQE
ncbi:hypothetical protein D5085_08170 [Ectothiorhodospiraceae bacterium BW-2]|nr:hypothetical protein D5085_08170 [Ectothiorhodospiraceae bacterium BW-2]